MLQGISKKAMAFTLNKKRITSHFFTSDILLKRMYDSQFLFVFFFNMAAFCGNIKFTHFFKIDEYI